MTSKPGHQEELTVLINSNDKCFFSVEIICGPLLDTVHGLNTAFYSVQMFIDQATLQREKL